MSKDEAVNLAEEAEGQPVDREYEKKDNIEDGM